MIDNGFLRMDNVRIPLGDMLMKNAQVNLDSIGVIEVKTCLASINLENMNKYTSCKVGMRLLIQDLLYSVSLDIEHFVLLAIIVRDQS